MNYFKGYNSVSFNAFTRSCINYFYPLFQNHISITLKGNPTAFKQSPPVLAPLPPAVTGLLSVSVDLRILDISYKCSPTIRGL